MANNTERKQSIIVALFIVAGLAIFLVAVFTLGGKQKRFTKTIDVKTIMNDVEGLIAGNNVWFSGVKIGTVKKIEFYGKSQVEVTLNIEKAVQKYIHKDSKTKLSSEGLIGDHIVVIEGGSVESPLVEDGDHLLAVTELGTKEIMQTFQENNKNLVAITANFKVLSDKILRGEGAAGALLSDTTMAHDLKATLANLSRTSAGLKDASSNINSFTVKLNNRDGSVNKILADTMIYASIQRSMKQLQAATSNAEQVSLSLQRVGNKLDKGEGPAGVILSDQETAQQIKEIVKNLEAGSAKLDQNMEALQHNFLLRGFFRKQAKEKEKQQNK